MPSLSLKANGTLLHRQLFVLLKQQIVSGGYREGERLPTQEALCAQFSVSRITVRRALSDLQTEGLIRNEQGSGAFVMPSKSPLRSGATLTFVEEMRRVVEETSVKVLGIGLERCPPEVAALLGVGQDDQALHVVRTRSKKRTPVMLLDAWIPSRFAPLVTSQHLKQRPLYHLISANGKNLGSVVQEINAALADALVADALAIDVGAPVLKINRLVHDKQRLPIQFMTIWSSPKHSRLVTEIAGENLNKMSTGRLQHDIG